MTGATIARTRDGAAVEPGTERSLTFHGARSATISAGRVAASDPAALPVSALKSLTVTLFFAGSTGPSTFHEEGLTVSYRAGYQTLIRAAHARGVRIIGATIIPFQAPYMSPADFLRAEAIRDQVNHWIRSSGEFDAVADFATAVADPADPEELNPAYNSGDFLHPNDAGYRAIAATINPNEL